MGKKVKITHFDFLKIKIIGALSKWKDSLQERNHCQLYLCPVWHDVGKNNKSITKNNTNIPVKVLADMHL